MYFNAEAQSRVLSRFASSLNPNGLLLLGRAEMLFSHSMMFTPVDLKRRLFRVSARANSRAPSAAPSLPSRGPVVDDVPEDRRLRQAVFETAPLVQLVFDQAGTLVAANAHARHQFAISPSDIGRALPDLEVSFRPAELRGAIDRAMQERRDVTIKDVHWAAGGETRHFDVTVSALFDDHHTPIGSRVVFDDVTRYRLLQSELYASRQELDTAYEELESTSEELETTNEELQTTNEQLETINEELQSMNE
jgi:two-component system CheB/CheR fusion protein